MMQYQVILYYLYRPVGDPSALAEAQHRLCRELGLMGRIIVSEEGINGTLSGPVEGTEAYRRAMDESPETAGIDFKCEGVPAHAFPKLSVKVRSEIVTLGLPPGHGVDPGSRTGKYLGPGEFYEAMQDRDAVILDGRNKYESDLGHFRGALCPAVENFRDFPDWIRGEMGHLKDRPILTYCTGGVRCEKLSGFLLEEGFAKVSQLEGGIVRYGQDEEMRGRGFEGSCYVFDERIAVEVNHTETRVLISRCRGCGEQSARYRNCAWPPCNAQFFCCASCEEKHGRFCGDACREKAEVLNPWPT